MRLRGFIILVGIAAAALPFAVQAQQPLKKVPQLCFLTFDPGTLETTRFKPFFEALHDLGYANGQTITIDYLSANGHRSVLPLLPRTAYNLRRASSL